MTEAQIEVSVERATRFRVVGVRINRFGVVDYTVMHDLDQITDGFSPDNFEAV